MSIFKLASSAAILLVLTAACGASDEPAPTETPDRNAAQDPGAAETPSETVRGATTICGTADDMPTCPPFGLPVTLEVEDVGTGDPRLLPDYRTTAYTGETVTFKLEGFRPDEIVQFFTTDETYDGARYRTEDDGTLTLPVFLNSSDDEAAEHYYVAVQDPEDGDPLLATFLIVILDSDAAAETQRDVVREALESVGFD